MTKRKSDVPNPEVKNETPKSRGGIMAEDRAKGMNIEQFDGPFSKQGEYKAAAEKKKSGKQKR